MPFLASFLKRAAASLRFGVGTTLALLTSACTPYVFAGVGYSVGPGEYVGIEHQGVTGTYGVGVEFAHDVSCEYRHRSMVRESPEIVTNDIGCEKRIYFGER